MRCPQESSATTSLFSLLCAGQDSLYGSEMIAYGAYRPFHPRNGCITMMLPKLQSPEADRAESLEEQQTAMVMYPCCLVFVSIEDRNGPRDRKAYISKDGRK